MYKHLQKEITLSLLSLVILFSLAFMSSVSTQAQVTVAPTVTVTPTLVGSTDGYQFYNYTISSTQQFDSVTFTVSCDASIIEISTKGGANCGEVLTNGFAPTNTYVLNMGYKANDTVTHFIGLSVTAKSASTVIGTSEVGVAVNMGSVSTGGSSGSGSADGGSVGTTTSCYTFVNNLTVGSVGADVMALQQFLVQTGFLKKEYASGYFGVNTKTAVMAYQTSVGLPSTGFVGPVTLAKLNASCASKGTSLNQRLIKLTNPNGEERWGLGSQRTIRWNAQHASSTDLVDIKMMPYIPSCTAQTCPVSAIASILIAARQPATAGSYVWTVGQLENNTVASAGKYFMQVCFTGTTICDGGRTYFVLTSSSTIKLLNLNGRENLNVAKRGGQVTIRWQTSGVAKNTNVQIGLIDVRYNTEAGLRPEQMIAFSIPDTGSYTWTIPRMLGTMDLTVTDQPVYKIVLHSWATDNGNAISDASAKPFAIISSEIASSTKDSSVSGTLGSTVVSTGTTITAVVNNPATSTAPVHVPVLLPTINSVSPLSGPVGTTVTLSGYGFVEGSIIKATIGGFTIKITPQSISSTQVVGVVPSFAAPGVYKLQVHSGKQGSNIVNFTVTKNTTSAAVWDAINDMSWFGSSFNK